MKDEGKWPQNEKIVMRLFWKKPEPKPGSRSILTCFFWFWFFSAENQVFDKPEPDPESGFNFVQSL